MPYIETESRYENTTMLEIRNKDNVLMGYDIAPVEGYVLHNSALDQYEYDLETDEQKELISHGYSYGSCSVNPDYDFDENPEEIYAIKEDAVREDGVIY